MEGLERIHQQILQEAQEEARDIEQAARLRKEAFLEKEQQQAEGRYQAALAEMRDFQQRNRAQLKADLSMKSRQNRLEIKQDWIRRVLAEGLRQLAERPAAEKVADYLSWLESDELKQALADQPQAQLKIALPVADRDLIELLAAKLPQGTEIEATRTDFKAGLLASVGLLHFNYTYEELLRRREEDLISSVSAQLFA